MNFTTEQLLELSPNVLGEVLMSYINPVRRWGYSTMDSEHIRSIPIEPSLHIRTLCCGCMAKDKREYLRIQTFLLDEDIKVYLYWDGDGTVVFEHPNWTIVNDDIKSDGWAKGDWALSVLESETYYDPFRSDS